MQENQCNMIPIPNTDIFYSIFKWYGESTNFIYSAFSMYPRISIYILQTNFMMFYFHNSLGVSLNVTLWVRCKLPQWKQKAKLSYSVVHVTLVGKVLRKNMEKQRLTFSVTSCSACTPWPIVWFTHQTYALGQLGLRIRYYVSNEFPIRK